MPAAADILESLTAIANQALAIAVFWHAVIFACLIALAVGWRPSRRAGATMLVALPASVGAVALAYRNPFNAASFALLAVLLGWHARHLGREKLSVGTAWTATLGTILIAYGLVYPHFLDARPLILYTVAAPTGLIPCPTLAVMIGCTLTTNSAFSRPWEGTLAAFGLFYALFGVMRLGVLLDAGLLIGALALTVVVLRPAPTRSDRCQR
jgi:hypothetical protein